MGVIAQTVGEAGKGTTIVDYSARSRCESDPRANMVVVLGLEVRRETAPTARDSD